MNSHKEYQNKIKGIIGEFFDKLTIDFVDIQVNYLENSSVDFHPKKDGEEKKVIDLAEVNIKVDDNGFLIGKNGQNLADVERLLRIIINKKLGKFVYLKLDINEYKRKKTDYLKQVANMAADEVANSKSKKVLSPMSPYERRVVHSELSKRSDVKTQSYGEGEERAIVILPTE